MYHYQKFSIEGYKDWKYLATCSNSRLFIIAMFSIDLLWSASPTDPNFEPLSIYPIIMDNGTISYQDVVSSSKLEAHRALYLRENQEACSRVDQLDHLNVLNSGLLHVDKPRP